MTKLHQLLFAATLPLFFALCKSKTCHEIAGRWTNGEGQTLVFSPGGTALWLIRFGSQTDSFPVEFRYDCKKTPAQLDLTGFKTGPMAAKTLFGIMEWNDADSFRLDAEPGTSPDARPTEFNAEQVQTWKKEPQ